jgi:hypothetical protein
VRRRPRNFSTTRIAFSPAPTMFEHRRDLPHLGRGHVAEDVAVPMNHAPLPSSVSEELGGAFGKPEAGVGDDQPHAGEPASFEMLVGLTIPLSTIHCEAGIGGAGRTPHPAFRPRLGPLAAPSHAQHLCGEGLHQDMI